MRAYSLGQSYVKGIVPKEEFNERLKHIGENEKQSVEAKKTGVTDNVEVTDEELYALLEEVRALI